MTAGGRIAFLRFVLRTTTAAFFVVGAVLLGSRFTEARNWPAVLGTVDELRLVELGGDEAAPGTRYRIAGSFSYEIDGQLLSSDSISAYDWVFGSEDRATAYLAQNRIALGARLPVYFDPDDPSRALVVRTIPFYRMEVILGFILLVVLPVAVVVWSLVDLIRGGASRRNDSSRGRFW